MNNLRNRVMFMSAVLAIFTAAGVPAQTVSTSPARARQGVMDANGDGICDITGRVIGSGQGRQNGNGRRNGPGDGTGYGTQSGKGIGAKNGNGSAGANCTGMGRASGGGRMNRGGRR